MLLIINLYQFSIHYVPINTKSFRRCLSAELLTGLPLMEFKEGSFRGQPPTLCTFPWPMHDLPAVAWEKIPLFQAYNRCCIEWDSLWQDNSQNSWLRNHLMRTTQLNSIHLSNLTQGSRGVNLLVDQWKKDPSLCFGNTHKNPQQIEMKQLDVGGSTFIFLAASDCTDHGYDWWDT